MPKTTSRMGIAAWMIMMMVSIFLTAFPRQGFSSEPDSLTARYQRGLNTDNWEGEFSYQKT